MIRQWGQIIYEVAIVYHVSYVNRNKDATPEIRVYPIFKDVVITIPPIISSFPFNIGHFHQFFWLKEALKCH